MNQDKGYIVIPAWEYAIVEQEGIFSTGGTCIFASRDEAIEWGKINARLMLPSSVISVDIEGANKEIPLISLYTEFYLLTADMQSLRAELNREPQLLEDGDIPVVWFTKERISLSCITFSEQIPTSQE